ncbi:MAG: hypothetical protein M1817_006928 [Caeruleum heppii]|nr:MAG: hypothetical protein M1817_006928 [Caeruleum heppii]
MDFETENSRDWDVDAPVLSEPALPTNERLSLLLRKSKPVERPNVRARKAAHKDAIAAKARAEAANRVIARPRPAIDPKYTNRFAVNVDNAGRALWRRREQPNGLYRLSNSYASIYESLGHQAKSSKGSPKNPSIQKVLEQIGDRTGTFVAPPLRAADREIRIWGDSSGVPNAQQELEKWALMHRTPSAEWAKINHATERVMERLDKKMKEDAFRQQFRQNPANSNTFSYVGYFLWPSEEFVPDAYLGPAYEAFDQIRIEERCHILYVSDKSLFKVLSYEEKSVNEAVVRIRTTLCEIVRRSSKPVRLYLTERLPLEANHSEVKLVQVNQTDKASPDAHMPILKGSVRPSLTGRAPTTEERNCWEIFQSDLDLINEDRFRNAISSTLPTLRYYRGNVRARVSFGTMAFVSYMRPLGVNHTLEEFQSMLKKAQTAGQLVKRFTIEKGRPTPLSRCRQATDFLDPVDASTVSLDAVRPQYSATFEVTPLTNSAPLRLEVDFLETDHGVFDAVAKRWLKVEMNAAPQDKVANLQRGKLAVAVNVMDLAKEVAWQLAIETCDVLSGSKLTLPMTDFADRVCLESGTKGAKSKTGEGGPKLVYSPNELRVQASTAKTHHRYRVRGSPYILEVTKCVQRSGVPTKAVVVTKGPESDDGKEEALAQLTFWEVSMYSTEWDMAFDKQPALSIGQEGAWSGSLPAFFPADLDGGDGFMDFVNKARTVSGLLATRGSPKKGAAPDPRGKSAQRAPNASAAHGKCF